MASRGSAESCACLRRHVTGGSPSRRSAARPESDRCHITTVPEWSPDPGAGPVARQRNVLQPMGQTLKTVFNQRFGREQGRGQLPSARDRPRLGTPYAVNWFADWRMNGSLAALLAVPATGAPNYIGGIPNVLKAI